MLDPRTEPPNGHLHPFLPRDSYGSWRDLNFPARTALKRENHGNRHGGGVQFEPETRAEDESGVCSPPLWKSSPPTSPSRPRRPISNYRHLSPNSRAQAIAKGQWELMEMVKSMPESCYELSLKDLVEHPRLEPPEEPLGEERSFGSGRSSANQKVKLMKRQESGMNERNAKMMRSGSYDNGGFLLKMVFPISLGSKKKKKLATTSTCSRVSPRPEATEKSSKVVDKEWWRKRFSASSESDGGATSRGGRSTGSSSTGSGGSSRSNSGRSTRRSRGCSADCWSFFVAQKRRGNGK